MRKIDPMKGPGPLGKPKNDFELEVTRLVDGVVALIVKHPENAKGIVYAMLGHAIACADTVGIDVVAFDRELREKFVKHPPLVFTDKWKPES